MIDSTLNRNLWAWGRAAITLPLGYPKKSSGFEDYIQRGYGENYRTHESDEAEAVGRIIDRELDRMQTEALKCKYRYRINKRLSAEYMNCSKTAYMDYFDQAILILTREMK